MFHLILNIGSKLVSSSLIISEKVPNNRMFTYMYLFVKNLFMFLLQFVRDVIWADFRIGCQNKKSYTLGIICLICIRHVLLDHFNSL